MSRIELESLTKSFLLFFISLSLLFGFLLFMQYKDRVKSQESNIFNEMKVCSFDLKCDNFDIDFVEKSKEHLYTLYKNEETVYSYFNIASSENFVMKFSLKEGQYKKILQETKDEYILEFLFVLFLVAIFSILFSFYALHPLRQALILTEEFIKDILHDFNTPLSALRLNTSMLKNEIGYNTKVLRIEQSVETVLNLQSNLKSYLLNETLQKEVFSLKDTLEARVDFVSKIYPNINFTLEVQDINLNANKDAFIRVIDNLLSNAAKYNKKDGSVFISYKANKKILEIKDTGRGIKNIQKVFQRFYKEHDRGIGIGLHIVKKLSDELGIKIALESEVGLGSTFSLNISLLTLD